MQSKNRMKWADRHGYTRTLDGFQRDLCSVINNPPSPDAYILGAVRLFRDIYNAGKAVEDVAKTVSNAIPPEYPFHQMNGF